MMRNPDKMLQFRRDAPEYFYFIPFSVTKTLFLLFFQVVKSTKNPNAQLLVLLGSIRSNSICKCV